MVDSNVLIDQIFESLHLTKEDALVYATLSSTGPLTLFQLAQKTKLPRTTLYRMVDILTKKGLLQEYIDEAVKKTSAMDLSIVEEIVNKEKSQLLQAEKLIPQAKKLFLQQTNIAKIDTKVLFYNGIDQLKQQVWNELRAEEKYIRSFTFATLEESFGPSFSKKVRRERIRRGIRVQDIISSEDKFLTSESLAYYRQSPENIGYDWKYLPQDNIGIDHQINIYDNVISFYDWQSENPFGIEIYNMTITHLQKQIFDILWNIAQTPEDTLKKRLKEKLQ